MSFRELALITFSAGLAGAQSNFISVVNSASYQTTLAPDSLATIFGSGLAPTTAEATLDSDGNLPLELAYTRVDVNGVSAALLYVSPKQINFVVPAGIGAGVTTLTVRSTNSSATQSASVTIAASAPALFTSDASGSGPGSILNAVTYAATPFVVDTPENGSDTRTRLALYGTGLRHAGTVTARATDSRGDLLDLAVEYAGAAPGYFGLDQINLVLPAALDGAGAASLTLTADGVSSNTVTAQIDLLPVARLRLYALALSSAYVTGGDSFTATLSLNGIARSGGFPVALRSTNPAAQPASVVTIAAGSATATSTVTTSSVLLVETGSIQATALGATLSADFEIEPATQAQLAALAVSPASVLGGRTVTGTVTLTVAAPSGGASVAVASDSDAARPPATVVVPFGQTSASFTIPTVAVSAKASATLTATLGHKSATATLTVLPPMTFTVDRASVTGGDTVTGTIALAEAAPAGGAQIVLSSADVLTARVLGVVTIASGLTTATFSIATTSVTSVRTVVISATYQGFTQTVSLTVNPPAAPALASLTLTPSTVTGGASVQGTVTLTAAAGFGGVRIDLRSSGVFAQVTAFLTIPQGSTSAQFTIATFPVLSKQSVTITAIQGSITKTAILTVQ